MNIAVALNLFKSGLLSYTDTLSSVKADVTVSNSDNFKNILKESVAKDDKKQSHEKSKLVASLENRSVIDNVLRHNTYDSDTLLLNLMNLEPQDPATESMVKPEFLESLCLDSLLRKLSSKNSMQYEELSFEDRLLELKLLLPVFTAMEVDLIDKSSLTLMNYSQNLQTIPKISNFLIVCLVCCNLMFLIRNSDKNENKVAKRSKEDKEEEKKRRQEREEKENNLNFASAFEFGL